MPLNQGLDLLEFVEEEETTLRHQIREPIRAIDGRVAISDAPAGLGIVMDEKGLRKYRG